MHIFKSRLEMEGDDTNYGKLVEDLGVWALAVTGDIRQKIEVNVKYIRNIFDLLPLVSWPCIVTIFYLLTA